MVPEENGGKEMKKRIIALLVITFMASSILTGCTEAERASYNLSQEADRKIRTSKTHFNIKSFTNLY